MKSHPNKVKSDQEIFPPQTQQPQPIPAPKPVKIPPHPLNYQHRPTPLTRQTDGNTHWHAKEERKREEEEDDRRERRKWKQKTKGRKEEEKRPVVDWNSKKKVLEHQGRMAARDESPPPSYAEVVSGQRRPSVELQEAIEALMRR